MRFAVGAILRNEFPYVLEWIAWHLEAGFDTFLLADNRSDDGTKELLEALERLGIVHLMHEDATFRAQLVAYRAIVDRWGHLADAIAFVDADEFLVADDGVRPVDHLARLFAPDVGAVLVNWRTYGSAGLEADDGRPVVQRFDRCGPDGHPRNIYVKSVLRPGAALRIEPHSPVLAPGFRHVLADGEAVSFRLADGAPSSAPTGIVQHVCAGPLRVNHYAVKSLAEFARKRFRGRSDGPIDQVIGDAYFRQHDANDLERPFPPADVERLAARIEWLQRRLAEETPFGRPLEGEVRLRGRIVSGWVDGTAADEPPEVEIAFGEAIRDRARAFRHVEERQRAGANPYRGFRYVLPDGLQKGDRIAVRVVANRFRFAEAPLVLAEPTRAPNRTPPETARNSGLAVLRDRDVPAEWTAVVLGVPGSGASMLAAVLARLGVPVDAGDGGGPGPVGAALAAGDEAGLRAAIAVRDAAGPAWGLRLGADSAAARLEPLLRDPLYLVVFRDPLAVAVRDVIATHGPIEDGLAAAARAEAGLVEFARRGTRPALLVSYDKAREDPAALVAMVAYFLGLAPGRERIEAARSVVVPPVARLPGPPPRYEGVLDGVEGRHARGWARLPGQERPQTVEIHAGPRVVGSGPANLFRVDLELADKEGGWCGFDIELAEPLPAAELEARIRGTPFKLHNPARRRPSDQKQ